MSRLPTVLAVVLFVLPLFGASFDAGELPAAEANLARAAVVSVSSAQSGFPKANAIDGDHATEWAANGSHPWIKLQWKEPVKVGRLVLRDRANSANRAQGGKLLFGDGSTLDVDDIPLGGAPCDVRFEPRTVTWLRLDLFSARGQQPRPGRNRGLRGRRKAAANPRPPCYPAPGTRVTIADKDPRITAVDGVREGKWSGAMWCPFAGTNVKLVGNTGPACGMADVYIDGIWQKTVDWYSEKPDSDVTMFAAEKPARRQAPAGHSDPRGQAFRVQGTAINWSRIEYIAGAHPERFVPVKRTRFDPNVPLWLDNRGEPIQGHMGGVMFHDGKYYMVGGDWRGKKLPGFPLDWCKNRRHGHLLLPRLDELDLPRQFLRAVARSESSPVQLHARCGPRQAPARRGHRKVRRPVPGSGPRVVRQRADLRDERHGGGRGRQAGRALPLARHPAMPGQAGARLRHGRLHR